VVVMTWFHFWLASCCRDFRADANRRPASTYRIINELPTILVIAIVVLAVVKPF
jgi:putative membrane protein